MLGVTKLRAHARRLYVLSLVVLAQVVVGIPSAAALSQACEGINMVAANMGNPFVARLPENAFDPGEQVTVSFHDNGQYSGTNPSDADNARVTSGKTVGTNVLLAYSSTQKIAGPQTVVVPGSYLVQNGIYVRIGYGTNIFSPSVSCTSTVQAQPVVLNTTPPLSWVVGAAYDHTFGAAGGSGSYTFSVTGGTLPNGLLLAPNGRLSGEATEVGSSTFTVTATDSNNGTGSETYTLQMRVGNPGQPTGVSAVAGDGEAIVSFTPPTKTGGAPIVQYVVGDIYGRTATGSSSPIRIGGLTNGEPTSFMVWADNGHGVGPESDNSNTVTPMGSQVILFDPPGDQRVRALVTLPEKSSRDLPITYDSNTPAVCYMSTANVAMMHAVGTCTITATQAGNTGITPAAPVTQSFQVTPAVPNAPIFITANVIDATTVDVGFRLDPNTDASPTLDYEVITWPGGQTTTGSRSPVRVTGLTPGQGYRFSVRARNEVGYSPESPQTGMVMMPVPPKVALVRVPMAQRYVTGDILDFEVMFNKTVLVTGTPQLELRVGGQSVSAVYYRGHGGYTLGFRYHVQPADRDDDGIEVLGLQLAGGTIRGWGENVGDVELMLNNVAVTSGVLVGATVPDAPTITSAAAGDGEATISFTPPASHGGTSLLGYTVTIHPGGETRDVTGSPATITGLVNGTAYTFTVAARNSVGTGALSAPSGVVMPVAPMVAQSIDFPQPAALTAGAQLQLVASASSGLPVAFGTDTAAICAVTTQGGITALREGDCIVHADQLGDAGTLPAARVTRHVIVEARVPDAPQISRIDLIALGEVEVIFNAPASDGGSPITEYVLRANPSGVVVRGTSSPLRVTGLPHLQPQTYTLTAINSAGAGTTAEWNTPFPVLQQPRVVRVGTPTPQRYLSGQTLQFSVVFDQPLRDAGPVQLALTVGGQRRLAGLVEQRVQNGGSVLAFDYVIVDGDRDEGGIRMDGLLATPGSLRNDLGLEALLDLDGVDVLPGVVVGIAIEAADVHLDVAQGATAVEVPLQITGGTATSVQIVTAPAHGNVQVDGTVVRYQPDAGYAGADSFTYTAGTAQATSAAATVHITVVPSVLELDAAAPEQGTAGTGYRTAMRLRGGTAPYSYAVVSGALPAGVTLSPTGELTGTPTVAGSFTFDVEVTDSSTGSGPFSARRSYTLVVAAPQISLSPEPLPEVIQSDDVNRRLAVSGGAAPYAFRLKSGGLPPGLTLGSDGTIEGTATSAGTYEFEVEVTDANGFVATSLYRMQVAQAVQQISALIVDVANPVYTEGGTFTVSAQGGASSQPVVFASTTPAVCSVAGNTVTMLSAGRCTLTADQAGDANHQAAAQQRLDIDITAAVPVLVWATELQQVFGQGSVELPLPTSPSPGAFTFDSSNPEVASISGRTVTIHGEGTVVITARQAASGSYAAASVELRLVIAQRPDPTSDADVTGLLQAQVDASVRFATAQQSNIRDRLRQVRNGDNSGRNGITLASGNGGRNAASLPLGQLADSGSSLLPQGWGSWASGTATWGRGGANRNGRYDLRTDGLTVGVDRALGEQMLFGVAGSLGRNDSELDSASRMRADQRSLALYGLWRASEHVFVDGMVATGNLEFDLRRESRDVDGMATASRDGSQWFGSLGVGYEQDVGAMRMTGYGRYDASRSTLDAYREQGLGAYDLAYGRHIVENRALAIGLEGAVQGGADARLRPFWSIEYRHALQDRGTANLNYAQWAHAQDYSVAMRSYNDNALSLSAGVDVQLQRGWLLSLLFGHEQARANDRSSSVGLRLSVGGRGGAVEQPVEPGPDAMDL